MFSFQFNYVPNLCFQANHNHISQSQFHNYIFQLLTWYKSWPPKFETKTPFSTVQVICGINVGSSIKDLVFKTSFPSFNVAHQHTLAASLHCLARKFPFPSHLGFQTPAFAASNCCRHRPIFTYVEFKLYFFKITKKNEFSNFETKIRIIIENESENRKMGSPDRDTVSLEFLKIFNIRLNSEKFWNFLF